MNQRPCSLPRETTRTGGSKTIQPPAAGAKKPDNLRPLPAREEPRDKEA
ncbi:MAG: hypothetical protein ABIJ95_01595 [Pseudomonadota bacterium]